MLSETMHPCFNSCSNRARIHLPVAPACNIQCNYCRRQFDCCNESRPGVTSRIMTPLEAAELYSECRRKMPYLTVAGIAGPGDPLANFDEVRMTLELIRRIDPNVILCLSTNGLLLPQRAEELYCLGVRYLTVTVNAISTHTGTQIYGSIQYEGRTFDGGEGFKLLLSQQILGIRSAALLGMTVKINTVVIPGINDVEIGSIFEKAREVGAMMGNLIPVIPLEGTPFSHIPQPSVQQMHTFKSVGARFLPQMMHCNRCRADACGKLNT